MFGRCHEHLVAARDADAPTHALTVVVLNRRSCALHRPASARDPPALDAPWRAYVLMVRVRGSLARSLGQRRLTLERATVTPGIMASEYAHRREVLVGSLPRNSVAVLFAGVETYMSNDIPYPYRQHTDFLYMTGFQEPAAAAVFSTLPQLSLPLLDADRNSRLLLANLNGRQSYRLFVRPRDPYREMWDGPRCGTDGLVHFGSEEVLARARSCLSLHLSPLLASWFLLPTSLIVVRIIYESLNQVLRFSIKLRLDHGLWSFRTV